MHARALLIVPLLLAGCVGAPETPAATQGVDGEPLANAVTDAARAAANATAPDAPVWAAGDAWSVTLHGGGAEQQAVFVVTKAESDAYFVETTSEMLATFDAVYDISFLGRFRAGDLAGQQRETPVRFFDFPLESGKTWTTQWDNREVALTATAVPSIPTPMGAQPGFVIVGTVEGEPYVTYDYVPALKWWSHLAFEDGRGFRVDRLTSNWTGALATATAETVYESTTAVPVITFNTDRFAVSEGQTMLLLRVHGGGPAWARAFTLFDPSGQPYMTSSPNTEYAPTPTWVNHQEQIPAIPGEWHISAPILHHPDSWFMVMVHQVALGTKAFPA